MTNEQPTKRIPLYQVEIERENSQDYLFSCLDCASRMPSQYKGELQGVSYCNHMSFYKTGWKRWDAGAQTMVIYHAEERDRKSEEDQLRLFGMGVEQEDFIRIRSPATTRCQHWNTNLRYISVILNSDPEELKFYEPELVEYVKEHGALPPLEEIAQYFKTKYPHTSDKVLQYIKDGMPLESVEYPRLFRAQTLNFPIWEIPDIPKYLDKNVCASCSFYYPLKDDRGSILPLKGICKRSAMDQGVFSAQKTTAQETYLFLTCNQHYIDRENQKVLDQCQPLSGKMTPFVEQGPPNRTIHNLRELSNSPRFHILPVLEQEQFDTLLFKDVFSETNQYRNLTSFNKLQKDLGLNHIFVFFAKALKQNGPAMEKYWMPLREQNEQAELELFGTISTDSVWGTGITKGEKMED